MHAINSSSRAAATAGTGTSSVHAERRDTQIEAMGAPVDGKCSSSVTPYSSQHVLTWHCEYSSSAQLVVLSGTKPIKGLSATTVEVRVSSPTTPMPSAADTRIITRKAS